MYSVNAFNNNKYIDTIIIVIRKKDKQEVQGIIKNEIINKRLDIVFDGNTRQQSVYNAIKDIHSDIVIIHDGARPSIKQKYIDSLIEEMINFNGAAIGVKTKDTIKITNDSGIVINTTPRKNTWLIQTPQCFNRNVLLDLHEKYKNDEVTDDCMLLEKGNYYLKIIEGDYTNIKVTTYEDINIISDFLKEQ